MSSKSDTLGIGVSGGEYEYSKRQVTDSNGGIVVTEQTGGKKKLVKDVLNSRVPFQKPSGEKVCDVSAQQHLNVTGGDYALIDPETDEPQYVFSQGKSFVGSSWKITDGESNEPVAKLEAEGKITTFFRRSNMNRFTLPGSYEITDPTGQRVGEVSTGWLSSTYRITLQDHAPVKDALIFSPLFIHRFEASR